MSSDRLTRPYGVYDATQCSLAYIGLHASEVDTWQTFLGWPGEDEIVAAKARGLKVLSLTVTYDPEVTHD